MRTNASMIEVNVCNSASAMPPQSRRLSDKTTEPFFFFFYSEESRGQVVTVVPMKSSPGPRLVNRYNRFALGCLLVVYAVAHTPILCCLSRSNDSSRCRNRMGGGLEGSERLCAVTAALPKERFICYILNLFYPFYFNVIYILILRISHIRSHYNIPIA